jgi:hypothetical protein
MHKDTIAARQQLRACADELDREHSVCRHDISYREMLGDVARLLNEREIDARVQRLWMGIRDERRVGRLMISDVVPQCLKAAPSATMQLEDLYPLYSEDVIMHRVRSHAASAPHIALWLNGCLEEARSAAATVRAREELGAISAVLGRFDAAREIARDAAPLIYRRLSIPLVLAIERFRRGEEAAEAMRELEGAEITPWDRIALALGFAGREPWDGYPFADWYYGVPSAAP